MTAGNDADEMTLLDHAERQTAALEALRNYAFVVLLLGAIGLVLFGIAVFGG